MRSSGSGVGVGAARLRRVVVRLEGAYGGRQWRRSGGGLDGLVATILSQNTSGANSGEAFRRLKRRFPSWRACMDSPVGQVEAAIRCGGLARRKAGRIQKILRRIVAERGRLSLEFLGRWEVDRARQWLTGLEGVGAKTAACVLMFNFGRPVLPVDTHVHRVSRRLGLIGAEVGAGRAHEILGAACPDELVYAFHVLLIEHGRAVCRARGPLCGQCVLKRGCAWRRRQKLDGGTLVG